MKITVVWRALKAMQWRKLWSLRVLELLILTSTAIVAYQATRQTNAVIENMRLERRAWLGLSSPYVGDLAANTGVDWGFVIQNSGSSPGATTFLSTFVFTAPYLPNDSRLAAEYLRLVSSDPEIQSGVIPPSATVKVPKTTTMSKEQADGIVTKKLRLYAIGILRYTDGLNYEGAEAPLRTTQFCLVYDPDKKELRLCPSNHGMD